MKTACYSSGSLCLVLVALLLVAALGSRRPQPDYEEEAPILATAPTPEPQGVWASYYIEINSDYGHISIPTRGVVRVKCLRGGQ